MEGFSAEKISLKEERAVAETVTRLKQSGYVFGFTETADEFIIKFPDPSLSIHITKIAAPEIPFEKIIEASVRFPDKKLAEAIKLVAE